MGKPLRSAGFANLRLPQTSGGACRKGAGHAAVFDSRMMRSQRSFGLRYRGRFDDYFAYAQRA